MLSVSEAVESLRAGEASRRALFEGDQRLQDRRKSPEYTQQLVEAARLYEGVLSGRLPMHYFNEAMTTSDFPLLFGDILDRQMLGNYREWPITWNAIAKRQIVPDFRTVKRFAIDGLDDSPLDAVPEASEYPEGSVDESADEFSVAKYGRRVDWTWERTINDDLDAFRDFPARLARAARRTEERLIVDLFTTGGSTPNATLYTIARNNIITGNPALSVSGLQTGFNQLAQMTDPQGEPVMLEMVSLVVSPQNEITARNILNAIEIRVATGGGGASAADQIIAQNWMRGRVNLVVNPYLSGTAWYLFEDPNTAGRPALVAAFLRGNEDPALFRKAPNAERIGGGAVNEDFATDSLALRVRHVVGGARLINTGGWRGTVASYGDGLAHSS